MKDRIRINLSSSPELYKMLEAVKNLNGFASICEMAITLLKFYALYVLEREGQKTTTTVSREIAEMFDEFEYWEPQPHDVAVPKRHKNNGKR